MMRRFAILVFVLLLFFFGYIVKKKQDVSVIDAHYDGSTAQVIVDKLPFFKSDKIAWWNKNKKSIMQKYKIPSDQNAPFLITIYAFGNGYEVESQEDRLCFSDVKPPKNCIDKNILMMIWRTREGGVKYQF